MSAVFLFLLLPSVLQQQQQIHFPFHFFPSFTPSISHSLPPPPSLTPSISHSLPPPPLSSLLHQQVSYNFLSKEKNISGVSAVNAARAFIKMVDMTLSTCLPFFTPIYLQQERFSLPPRPKIALKLAYGDKVTHMKFSAKNVANIWLTWLQLE